MKKQTFTKDLPENYTAVFTIDATNTKTVIFLNLLAIAVLVPILLIGIPPVVKLREFSLFSPLLLLGGIAAYLVLHELTHGIVYKKQTGEKLTFGIQLSCAFCGVPNIYIYRRTALLAVAAPFLVFTLILLPLAILSLMYFPGFYLVFLLLFAVHFSGCVGDLYVLFLLLFRYKTPLLLVQDTGPKQTFFLPKNADNIS